MDVLMGPTFSIDVSSSPAYGIDRDEVHPAPEENGVASTCLFLKEDEKDGVGKIGTGVGSFGHEKDPDEDDSDASSSIGAPDDDSDEEDGADEAVQSRLRRGLSSLDSLEDSLPTKRGLSNHFSGKSKSFVNLSEACSAKDLEKQENPFNKRRRLLIAGKLSRKSSFYTCHNPKSMPLLALKEDDEEYAFHPPSEIDEEEAEEEEAAAAVVSNFHQRRLKNLKSFSCISLSEMENHHHHHHHHHHLHQL